MTDTTENKDSMAAVVVAALAIILIVWGWARAHSTPDMNPVSAPKVTKGGNAPPVE